MKSGIVLLLLTFLFPAFLRAATPPQPIDPQALAAAVASSVSGTSQTMSLDNINPVAPLFTREDIGPKGNLTVVIKNFRSDNGDVFVSLFKTADGFPAQHEKAYLHKFEKVSNGTVTAVFNGLPLGKYALSIWHDENSNSKMETNWLGMPKEGIGVSNNAKGSFGPPKFQDAQFEFNLVEPSQSIMMHYL